MNLTDSSKITARLATYACYCASQIVVHDPVSHILPLQQFSHRPPRQICLGVWQAASSLPRHQPILVRLRPHRSAPKKAAVIEGRENKMLLRFGASMRPCDRIRSESPLYSRMFRSPSMTVANPQMIIRCTSVQILSCFGAKSLAGATRCRRPAIRTEPPTASSCFTSASAHAITNEHTSPAVTPH